MNDAPLMEAYAELRALAAKLVGDPGALGGHLLGRDIVKGKGSGDTERHSNGGGPPFSGVTAEYNYNQGCA